MVLSSGLPDEANSEKLKSGGSNYPYRIPRSKNTQSKQVCILENLIHENEVSVVT